jgi:hypothetical protein
MSAVRRRRGALGRLAAQQGDARPGGLHVEVAFLQAVKLFHGLRELVELRAQQILDGRHARRGFDTRHSRLRAPGFEVGQQVLRGTGVPVRFAQ